MSKHKHKRRKKIPNVEKKIENPKFEEVNKIENKIKEEDKAIYELKNNKMEAMEDIIDFILLNNDFKDLLNTYLSIDTEINKKIERQNNRKKDLEFKKQKLKDENPEITIEEPNFLKIGDVDYRIGLYNQECKNPVAICSSKNVFLSYKDIRNKKCLKHRNKPPCKHLVWLNSDF